MSLLGYRVSGGFRDLGLGDLKFEVVFRVYGMRPSNTKRLRRLSHRDDTLRSQVSSPYL